MAPPVASLLPFVFYYPQDGSTYTKPLTNVTANEHCIKGGRSAAFRDVMAVDEDLAPRASIFFLKFYGLFTQFC